ncbi:unnamed protein product, partial [Effrenium voratum]
VISAVEKAIGGVLFIDEAYSLKKEGKDAFGQEAVDTLIKEIEDKRDKVIAIFAGYEKEMETFFEANPGFKSRVPFKFYFDDYTCSELSQIAGIFMEDKGFRATDGAQLWVNRTVRFATGCCDTGDCQAKRDSGNGRTVRNILEAAYRNFASRIVPRLYYSRELRPVLDRVEQFAVNKKDSGDLSFGAPLDKSDSAMGYPYLDRPDDELAFPMPGGFDRGKNRMQQWILPDSPHPPASGRYHLFLNYSCGWSGQALLARSLKGLTEVVSISHTLQCPVRPNGWPILQPDPTGNGFTTACEVYNSNNPDYGTKQLTVPILFDKESKKVVSNDPAHILLMLNEAFGDMGNSLDLYPVDKRQEIEEVNSILYPGLNDGVYRCGFAQEDEHYLLAFEGLQAALRFMDQALLRQKFLCGDQLTLADVRAFPHLIRFDLIYRQLMLRASPPPPSLPDAVREYVRRLYEYPEVKVTCDPHLALVGYFAQLGRLRGLTKTIAEDDEMYEQYKYEWLPSKRELELKRKSEGLPEKAEHHLPA